MLDLSKGGPDKLQLVETAGLGAPVGTLGGGLASDATAASSAGLGAADGGAAALPVPTFLATARHPGACLAHLGFKVLALTAFLLGSFLFGGWEGDYVFTFVVTTLLLSVDFWVVKNVTGRLLVGMRWWNQVNEADGSQTWVYESAPDTHATNRTDSLVFWSAIYAWPLLWAIFAFVEFIRLQFEWLLLVLIALTLALANLVGYWNCSKETQARMSQWAASTGFLRTLLGRIF